MVWAVTCPEPDRQECWSAQRMCSLHLLVGDALMYVDIFFFFQAEDGIRDVAVTGVQTCALPISTGAKNQNKAAKAITTSSTMAIITSGLRRRGSASPFSANGLNISGAASACGGDRKSVV